MREIVAYSLLAVVVLPALLWFLLTIPRRRRARLRRRGIKRYGH